MDEADWQPVLECMGFENEDQLEEYANSFFESDPWMEGYEEGYADGTYDA